MPGHARKLDLYCRISLNRISKGVLGKKKTDFADELSSWPWSFAQHCQENDVQVNENHTNAQQLLSICFLSCLVCGVSRDILQDLQSLGQKHPSMEARTKRNYTIVPAIEDNADSLECFLFHFVRYL